MPTPSCVRPASLLVAAAMTSFPTAALAQATSPEPVVRGDAERVPPASPPAAPTKETAPSASAPAPPPEPPEEVRVVGAKTSRVAGSVHVIGKTQLDRFEHDDPHAIVTAVPGVYVRGEDGFGLRPNIGIRGAASDRSKKITLMEDGVLFGPAPYSAPAAYYFPLMTRMRSVRIIKGPGAIVYGPQTVGGAIDLVTQDIPSGPKLTVDVAGGQFGYRKAHLTAGTSDEKLGVFVEGVHVGTTGFKQIDGVGGDTGYGRDEWMGKVSYQLPKVGDLTHELMLKAGYSGETSHETYVGLSDADLRADPYRRYVSSRYDTMQWSRTQLALSHRARVGSSFEIVTTAYRHDMHRVWRKVNGLQGAEILGVLTDPQSSANAGYYGVLTGTRDSTTDGEKLLIGPNDRAFVSTGVQTVLKLRAKTGPVEHRVEYGTRLHYDSSERRHSQNAFLTRNGALVPDGGPEQVTLFRFDETYALAFHVADAVSWERLTVTPGVRFELIQSSKNDRLTGRTGAGAYQVALPGVGAFYGLTKDFGVLAGVYRGFSPPPPGENPKLTKPEDSTNYEGGLRYAGKAGRFELIGFFNDYENLTDICTFSNGCVGENLERQFPAGRVRIWGLEVFGESAIELPHDLVLPLRVAYTLTRSEFLTDFKSDDPAFDNVRAGDELPYVPKHQASAGAGVETKRAGVNLAATYVGTMRERAGSGTPAAFDQTDSAFLLDASGRYVLGRGFSLYANVRNVFDNAYIASRRPYGARPGAPRFAQVGLKAEF